ncbi:hypothetical protein [Flagellimonas onchidii]|uniref:hypothetical protein n=1 Tax=Flagellimonas onchidii TaxID=2562684 RepID=UPI0010A6910C|nr:hypothetical protein [Allomuricauda onchidii]
MNSAKIFLSLAVTLLFISCNKDEDTTPVDSESLIGTWSLISLDADIDLDTDFSGLSIKSSTKSVGENFDYTLTFTETTYAVEGGYDLVTTGTVNGEPLDPQTNTIDDLDTTGTYEFSEDSNSITIDGQLYNFDLDDIDTSEVSLDQDISLVFDKDGNLVMTENQQATISEDGITLSYTADIVAVFERM